ncbi:retrovirus-related pol polyprotein from transposon TNT 1-94 [Tanacetum coccineum]
MIRLRFPVQCSIISSISGSNVDKPEFSFEHKHLFKELQVVKDGHVSFGDASKVQVKGRDLKSNILSLGQLMERGYSVRMNGWVLQLNGRNGMRVARVEMENNRMYKLNFRSMQERCLQVDVDDKVSLWHLRLECVTSKQTRCSFPKKMEYRATNTLELIHTDIYGIISPESFSRKRYFITFIDDYSRKTWVYFLKEKSEAFEVFKKFKVMVERTTSKFIRALRSNMGAEYVSTNFMNFFEEQGIRRFLTASYSPQQNGVAKRKNHTILDMACEWDWGKYVEPAVEEQGKTTSIFELTNNGINTSNELPSSDDEAEPRIQRTCTLQELYDSTGEVHLLCLMAKTEDISFEEALRIKKWKTAIDEEIKAIERNKTWDLVELLSGTQPIGVKLVFTNKMNAQCEIERLAKDVYVEQPLGYMKVENKKKVLKLKKCTIRKNEGNVLFVPLYVDDLIFIWNNKQMIKDFKELMTQEFEMTYLGMMNYFLGLEVIQGESGIFLSQEVYAKEILKNSKMVDCNRISTPMELGTKLSKFDGGTKVNAIHGGSSAFTLEGIKENSTIFEEQSLGLHYSHTKECKLVGYSDSDWCEDIDDQKITSRYVFFIGEMAFTWLSKKQPIVTLSTCEAEYVETSLCVSHAIWLRNLLIKMENQQHEATHIRVDNKAGIELAKNPVNHERSKYINIRFHFIRDHVMEGRVQLVHVPSRDQVADIFTKPLLTVLLENYKRMIGMKDIRELSLRSGVENKLN